MNVFYKILLLFTGIIVLSGCNHRDISSGQTTVSGKFVDLLLTEQNNTSAVITLSIPNLVLGEITEYQKTIEPDGSFTIDVPIIYPVYAEIAVGTKMYDGRILISPGETTCLELFQVETNKIELRMIQGVEIKSNDLENMLNVNNKMIMAFVEGNNAPKFRLPITLKEYADSMLIRMEKELEVIHVYPGLSEIYKGLLYHCWKPLYLKCDFLEYEDHIGRLYRNQQYENNDKEDTLKPPKPDKSYYFFLRYFDLNNPPQLPEMYYSLALRSILTQPSLNIPRIGDSPVANWLKEVKSILTDLTGVDSGIFYDILAAESYVNQFWDELNPLSEQQKKNVLNYFSNPSFANILFAENEKTILRLAEIEKNKQENLVINETPSAAKGELMDAIISKYKGKVVLVDFWATWCGPCLQAINESKELKQEMLNKDVTFVYLTNNSSPKELWNKKIRAIGGEHYYLTGEEWESISHSDKYGFEGIPTYLIFDKNGLLIRKITGYPGNEKMQAMIEQLLP
jgi:thiol-disulfide isomerase/thioredoxin